MQESLRIRSKNSASCTVCVAEPLNAILVAALEADWNRLSVNAAEPNVFLEHWMVQPALPMLIAEQTELLMVRDNGALIGLMLLREDRGYAHLPLGLIKTSLHPHQFSGTPLVKKGCETQFVEALCEWLDELPSQAGFCQLTHLAGDGPIASTLKEVCCSDDRRCDEIDRYERAVIEGHGTVAAYLDTQVSSSLRKQLGRKRRRLEEKGVLTFEQLENPGLASDWLEDFLLLENKGWKGDVGTSILSNPVETAFFRAFVPAAATRQSLRFSRLSLDGKAIAYALDLISDKQVFAHKVAYDPDYGKFSPGHLLDYDLAPTWFADPAIDLVDSCAPVANPVPSNLWSQRTPIVQILIGRKGLRHEWMLGFARLLEEGAASIRSLKNTDTDKG